MAVYLLAWVPVLPYNTLYYLEPKVNIKVQQGRLAQWFDLAVDFRGCRFESSYITFCLNININCYESLNINLNVNKMLNINLRA